MSNPDTAAAQPVLPAGVQNPDALEVAPGFQHENLEGWIPALAGDTEVREALEKAFDYRGDVTITRKDGGKIEGYIFDRRAGSTLTDSFSPILPHHSNQTIPFPYAELTAPAF